MAMHRAQPSSGAPGRVRDRGGPQPRNGGLLGLHFRSRGFSCRLRKRWSARGALSRARIAAAGPQHPHELAETGAPNMQGLTINASAAADDRASVGAALDMEAVDAAAQGTWAAPLAAAGRLQVRAALRPVRRCPPLAHHGVSTLVAASRITFWPRCRIPACDFRPIR